MSIRVVVRWYDRPMPTIATALILAATGLARLSSGIARAAGPTPEHGQVRWEYLIRPDGIEWRTFTAIQAAVTEANRKGMKPEICKIWAVEDAEDLAVVFTNPQPPGQRVTGCPPGPCRCFEVLLDRNSLEVKSALYSK